MTKIIVAGSLLLALVVSGIWYFFGREYDYKISFTVPSQESILYYKLQNYGFKDFKVEDQERVKPFEILMQEGTIQDEKIKINWYFDPINDSLTKITAGINYTEDPLKQRLKFLFNTDPHQERIREEMITLKRAIHEDEKLYKVQIQGEGVSPASTCACLPLETEAGKKAFEMMTSINYLSDFVLRNNLEPEGRPRVHVKQWGVENGRIQFDFCFPLKAGTLVPEDKVIFKKEMTSVPVLKAVYNGNYMYSHYAWLKLIDHAEKNNIQLEKTPIEVFNDNPEMGGEPINWTAEIYMPLKQK